MPEDKPGNPTPPEVSVEDRMKELEALKASVEADRAELAEQRRTTEALNATMENIAQALQPRPEPEPDEPMPETYDENTLEAAGQIAKKMLRGYHQEISPVIESLAAGQFESEWERVKRTDPKNFGRMEKTMRQYFDKNPTAKQPGAVDRLFVQMRGTHYDKLREMDAAERQAGDETADLSSNLAPTPKGKASEEHDEFNEDELRVVRGMGPQAVHPEDYFLARYGRMPNFPDGYVEKLGAAPKERS